MKKRIEVDVKCERCSETYTILVIPGIPTDYTCFCGNSGKVMPTEAAEKGVGGGMRIKDWILSKLCPECPILRGVDAERFTEQMENPKPCGMVPTPRLKEAIEKLNRERDNRRRGDDIRQLSKSRKGRNVLQGL